MVFSLDSETNGYNFTHVTSCEVKDDSRSLVYEEHSRPRAR